VAFLSFNYLLLLLIALPAYGLAPKRAKIWVLLAASYAFYGSCDPRHLALLAMLTLINFGYGRWIARDRERQLVLWSGIGVNLAVLVYFKYLWSLGAPPLGVSFFTFQGIAYLVDVAWGSEPLRSLPRFALFRAFWPQIVAGPIVRLGEVRADLETLPKVTADGVATGLQRILMGLCKKVVIADNLATYLDLAFQPGSAPNAADALTAILGFSVQLYFDFSGYSDLAIGSARLFGFTFPENFARPFAARTPQEFWNRWHMTLTRWIRDYVFMPLLAVTRDARLGPACIAIAMVACGLWHGADPTFLVWGLWHGLFLAAYAVLGRRTFPGAKALWLAATWIAILGGSLLFRAHDLEQVGRFVSALLTVRGGLRPAILRENTMIFVISVAVLTLAGEAAYPAAARRLRRAPLALQYAVEVSAQTVLCLLVILFAAGSQAFVYFRF
jgi:alginate O-acetyltransferase complex protein AlgI